jgi:hypothetical protein
MIAEQLLGSVVATAAGGFGYLAVTHKREKEARERERRITFARFRESLVTRLRTKGPSRDFSFGGRAEEYGVARAEADQVADELYRQFCGQVLADGVITERERKQLGALARFLDWTPRGPRRSRVRPRATFTGRRSARRSRTG